MPKMRAGRVRPDLDTDGATPLLPAVGDGVTTIDDGTAAPVVPGALINKASRAFSFDGVITPTQLTADQNDYAPSGATTATQFRLSSAATRSITGLAGGSAGRLLVLANVGTNSITLVAESALSTAANRFAFGTSVTLVGGAVLTLLYDGTTQRWRAQAGTGGAGGGSGSAVQAQWVEVSSNQTTTATTWPIAQTTVAAGSNGVALPTGTINVASAAAFPAAGKLVIQTAAGPQIVSYTGKGATTFTGCTGGTGTLTTGALVNAYLQTTIAAGSNGASLPQGTINVASTTGFPASGTLLVTTALGQQLVTYTGVGATTFTGCTGGAGVMSTGGAVLDVTATAQDLLRIELVTMGGALVLQAIGSSSNATNNQVVFFRVLVDGAVIRGGSTKSNGGSGVTAFALSLKFSNLAAGAHTVVVQWRVNSGTGQVRPIIAEDENASLLVQEVSS